MSSEPLHKPTLIVIAGPNGSGKTTITSKFLQHGWLKAAEYINPDIVAQEIFGNWNDSHAVLQALQYCDDKREECLCEHSSMIFESVMSTDSKVDFIRKAKEEGYFIRVFFISTNDPSINASRIAKRVMKGGHGVPIEKIISRFSKSIINCGMVSKIVDRTYVYDNSSEDSEATILFRLSDGKLVKQYVKEVPKWAECLRP
ncbi:MAG: AAA family ATPase [Prevotella sp.]|nr:AAA family ATPase [Prevotella sp.]